MEPKSLSASAALVAEGCLARFKAEYIDRVPNYSGSAADLGTAVHGVLEVLVKSNEHYVKHTPKTAQELLLKLWTTAYYGVGFTDKSRFDEGFEMVMGWWKRTDFSPPRTVLSTEVKETFPLAFKYGTIPVTYIWDRCDKLDDAGKVIEVVDYKTYGQPLPVEELAKRIQPRVYALAAKIKYPQAERIWVTYDLLRHDQIGMAFSRDDCVDTWRYLQHLATRVWESNPTGEAGEVWPPETLNPECRWCVRKNACSTLDRHVRGGGRLAITDPVQAATRRAQLEYASQAIKAECDDLDSYLQQVFENEDCTEIQAGTDIIYMSSQSRRNVDAKRVAKVTGPEILADYGKLNMKEFDLLLKDPRLNSEQKGLLKGLVGRSWSDPSVKVKPLPALGGDSD